jgi:predicted neuraminidase
MSGTLGTMQLPRDGKLRRKDGDYFRSETFLPSTTRSTHASFLMTLADGSLGCVWFAGSMEGQPDVSIYFSRLEAGSDTWGTAEKISDDLTRSEQNPVLFPAPDGTLWVLYTSQDFNGQGTSIVKRRISTDNGKSWGPIEVLFDRAGTFLRQPVVVLDNGDWMIPIFSCDPIPGENWHGHDDYSAVQISSDGGKTWTRHEVPDSKGSVHMCVVKLDAGKLVAFYRSRWADFVYRSASSDNGRTWSAPVPTELPNNNSSVQVTRLADGQLAIVFNASRARPEVVEAARHGTPQRAVWGTPRAPITIALSSDAGLTWPARRDIDDGDGWCRASEGEHADRLNAELSYPTVHQTADGLINVAFTWHRLAIKHVRFPQSWISREV